VRCGAAYPSIGLAVRRSLRIFRVDPLRPVPVSLPAQELRSRGRCVPCPRRRLRRSDPVGTIHRAVAWRSSWRRSAGSISPQPVVRFEPVGHCRRPGRRRPGARPGRPWLASETNHASMTVFRCVRTDDPKALRPTRASRGTAALEVPHGSDTASRRTWIPEDPAGAAGASLDRVAAIPAAAAAGFLSVLRRAGWICRQVEADLAAPDVPAAKNQVLLRTSACSPIGGQPAHTGQRYGPSRMGSASLESRLPVMPSPCWSRVPAV